MYGLMHGYNKKLKEVLIIIVTVCYFKCVLRIVVLSFGAITRCYIDFLISCTVIC